MILIPGPLIAILTFPGIILHEVAHKLSCNLAGVPVYKTCYFRVGNPAGYVVHGSVHSYGAAFLISIAPFLLNTCVALLLFIIAVNVSSSTQISAILLFWLGISVAMHSFPSGEDADNLWGYSKAAWRYNFWANFGFPVVILIKLAGILSIIWFDLLYAAALLFLVVALFNGGNLF